MCGSVRGVGAGGIVSTAFCILYKLLTLKPTRKQILSMIKNKDSPFIRATGFLFIRYTQPPDQLWNWFSKFLLDPEEFQPRAGYGHGFPPMTIGEMVRNLLTKLEWFSTLFPRIPVPIQKDIDQKLREFDQKNPDEQKKKRTQEDQGDSHKKRKEDDEYKIRDDDRRRERSRSRERRSRSRDKFHRYEKSSRNRSRDRSSDRKDRSYHKSHHRR